MCKTSKMQRRRGIGILKQPMISPLTFPYFIAIAFYPFDFLFLSVQPLS